MPETPVASTTYALTLAYNGAAYAGFARQKDPAISTIQEILEAALATALRLPSPPPTVCAGRTDAGVHARSQVVSFALAAPPPPNLLRSLNALTPPDLSVRALAPVASGFSARFDAQWREYRYRLYNCAEPPLFTAAFSHHDPQRLDIGTLRQAALSFIGEHDFRSFCTSASADPETNTRRRILELDVLPEEAYGEQLLTIRVRGSAFLHSMVRILVGTLLEVGLHKRSVASCAAALAAKTRAAAGFTAPARGLTLHRVSYEPALDRALLLSEEGLDGAL
jgi:tRNA pseudouridine38-40 synthase